MIDSPFDYILETRGNCLELVHFRLRECGEEGFQEQWIVLHECLLHLFALPRELGADLVQEGREVLGQLAVEVARVDALERGREGLRTLTEVVRGQDVRQVHFRALEHEEGEVLEQVDVYALAESLILT